MDTTDNAAPGEDDGEPAEARTRRPHATGRLALSVEEVSHLLGISTWLAYAMVAQGQIPAIRLGRRLVVPRAALDQMLSDATARERGSDGCA